MTSVTAGDRRVHALTRLGRVLTSTADYDDALRQLIVAISELLDVETAGFLLFEPDSGQLVLQQPAFGISDPDVIRAYRVPISRGGNAVRVFTTLQPYLTNDACNDPNLLSEYVAMYNARSSITVPLVVENRAIGVCHAINKRGDFTDEDLSLLSLMAPLLAVSVQSAALFRDLREQRRRLERAVFLQRQLSHTAFDSAGLGPLTQRLADLVDRPVMVLDPAMQPLARARWPEAVAPEPCWVHEGDGFGLRSSGRQVPAVAPIAVGPHLGGYLAVLDQDRPLDDIDAGAIEHAATVFALEMLRERTASEAQSRVHSDMMSELFDGGHRDEGEAMQLLDDLGYTIAGPWRVGRLHVRWDEIREGRWTQEVQPPKVRLHDVVRARCLEMLEAAATAPWRAGFLLLLPATPGGAEDDTDIAHRLLAALRRGATDIRPGAHVHLALSSPATTASQLRARLGEAEQGLGVARRLGVEDRPLIFEHLGIYQVLLGGGGPLANARFIDGALGPLRRHDEAHGTELVITLRGYVAADHNAAAAARAMFLHPNTLAYRLRTIRRLLSGDPSRGDLRLQLELALKLDDLSSLTGAAPLLD